MPFVFLHEKIIVRLQHLYCPPSALSPSLHLSPSMFALSKNDCVAELLPLMEDASDEKLACAVSGAVEPPLNLEETELSLGPPGSGRMTPPLMNLAKRGFDGAGQWVHEKEPDNTTVSSAKAQVVGWPPIRSFRKNSMASSVSKSNEKDERRTGYDCLFVKVSMEGVPFLRKVDLKMYSGYTDLSSALEKMFSGYNIGKCGNRGLHESAEKDLLGDSEYVLTYEDKDGDLMLVGDVPWEMFICSCKKLKIMKSSEAVGLGMC